MNNIRAFEEETVSMWKRTQLGEEGQVDLSVLADLDVDWGEWCPFMGGTVKGKCALAISKAQEKCYALEFVGSELTLIDEMDLNIHVPSTSPIMSWGLAQGRVQGMLTCLVVGEGFLDNSFDLPWDEKERLSLAWFNGKTRKFLNVGEILKNDDCIFAGFQGNYTNWRLPKEDTNLILDSLGNRLKGFSNLEEIPDGRALIFENYDLKIIWTPWEQRKIKIAYPLGKGFSFNRIFFDKASKYAFSTHTGVLLRLDDGFSWVCQTATNFSNRNMDYMIKRNPVSVDEELKLLRVELFSDGKSEIHRIV